MNTEEKQDTEFQEAFFEALTLKATRNYRTAVEKLEHCNSIIPNKKAVFFELAKNYTLLNKLGEARIFIEKAIALEADNYWLLRQYVEILNRDASYPEAIVIQKKIASKDPRKQDKLVELYLKNSDRKSTIAVLERMKSAKIITPRLRRIYKKLTQAPKKKVVVKSTVTPKASNLDFETQFNANKSFNNLKQLLLKLEQGDANNFIKYTTQGMELYPAQPFVYLMNGKAMINAKQYKKAIESLESGVDFVFDDIKTEHQFYKQLVIAFKALGDTKKVKKYTDKLK